LGTLIPKRALSTDYLVVGAGASGLAFADALVAETDADVLLVDRRPRVGGHWNEAYEFLRLHIPSANYGVNSLALGDDGFDEDGGYERATGPQVRDYFHRVLDEQLLPTGRVGFLGERDYVDADDGRHRLRGPEGTVEEVTVRRKLVDTRYMATDLPALHTPSFAVEAGAQLVPVGKLADGVDHERYTILGSGKTAIDACLYLLDAGVDPGRITWVRPRDQWLLDRASLQPLDQVGSIVAGFADDIEAAAQATSVDDLFLRLEASGRLLRIDPAVTPTMYRCAIVTRRELEQLRSVEDVVRLGRVRHIAPHEIALAEGTVPTTPGTLHIDCTANGLHLGPLQPIFAADRITIQQVRPCSPVFNAALIGYIEATRDDVDEQNRLCPPNQNPNTPTSWLLNLAAMSRLPLLWQDPDLVAWLERSRLNLVRGTRDHRDDPRVQNAAERNRRNYAAAAANVERFLRDAAAAA
jgi:hypothetical protein